MFPAEPRRRAIEKAVAFVTERLNGEDGLGGIFPAMANALMMYDCLGYPADHPNCVSAASALRKLVVEAEERAYCQPCVSPVWDTALACHALMEVSDEGLSASIRNGLDWLKDRQVLDTVGDWAAARPGLRPGGWAAFDVDNVFDYLNNIPFADHGALIDPPTEDVTARCLSMFAQLGETPQTSESVARGVEYLRRTQLGDGSWYGRWGLNYIYGTWSSLCALNACGVDHNSPEIRKAVKWLLSIQNSDGGWGEDGTSYRLDYRGHEPAASTSSQTAWALLGLMACGEVRNPAVARGVQYLAQTQTDSGFWDEERFTATGFPRVFYLRYHGYRKFFPLWAMARYRNLTDSNSANVAFGM